MWLLIIAFLLTLAAVPVTLAAVALRPSQLTVRAAAGALLALPFLGLVVIAIAALA